MANNYAINCMSRGVNNFFESLTNSSNPTYIQPINTSFSSNNSNNILDKPHKFEFEFEARSPSY